MPQTVAYWALSVVCCETAKCPEFAAKPTLCGHRTVSFKAARIPAVRIHRGKPVRLNATERLRGFLESLADAARYRLGSLMSDLPAERIQFPSLFAQHLVLLFAMGRPEFHDV